jgi:hypothetical protein
LRHRAAYTRARGLQPGCALRSGAEFCRAPLTKEKEKEDEKEKEKEFGARRSISPIRNTQ